MEKLTGLWVKYEGSGHSLGHVTWVDVASSS